MFFCGRGAGLSSVCECFVFSARGHPLSCDCRMERGESIRITEIPENASVLELELAAAADALLLTVLDWSACFYSAAQPGLIFRLI